MATVIFSDTVLTDTTGLTYLPDLSYGLIASFRAENVTGVTSGEPVTSLTFTGSGETTDRTYANQMSSWPKPLWVSSGGFGGGAYLQFADGRRISNATSSVWSVSEAVPQPITRALRVKINDWAAGTLGIIRVINGDYLQTIQPSDTVGSLTLNAGTSVTIAASIPDETWTTLIVCFDGENSWLKVGTNAKITFNAGSDLYVGEILGGNAQSTVPSSYLNMQLDAYDRWHRAITDDEANVWALQMS